VNAEVQISASDPTVGEFLGLLDRLEEKSSNSRREIADLCMAGYLWRKERGNLDTLLEFTRSVARDLPDQEGEADLREFIRDMLEND